VFDANPEVIRDLKEQGVVLRHETYDHSYPHCWRTGTPLIYRAVSSWFVQVTAIKQRMLELNQEIDWTPEHLRDGSFGKWLANARDWTISRNRFWGSPIPVWRSDDPSYPRIDVYGSLDELERDFGVRPDDLHRPFVDELVRPNPDDPTGESMMRASRRCSTAGSSRARCRSRRSTTPFENREWFESHYPGDFIVEYVAQTRGWFYTMHVLADRAVRPAGVPALPRSRIVLGDDGLKMSKSLATTRPARGVRQPRRRRDPLVPAQLDDPARRRLLRDRGGDPRDRATGAPAAVEHVVLPVALRERGRHPRHGRADVSADTHVLDRYILAKTRTLVDDVTASMDDYDLFAACGQIRSFLDALTNWYVRRSRDRFWSGDQDAVDTLHTCLTTLCRVAGTAAAAHDRCGVPRSQRVSAASISSRGRDGSALRRRRARAGRWTSRERCARRRCVCARRISGECASRCRH
jgi:isoleucyl-tRNA synthetase